MININLSIYRDKHCSERAYNGIICGAESIIRDFGFACSKRIKPLYKLKKYIYFNSDNSINIAKTMDYFHTKAQQSFLNESLYNQSWSIMITSLPLRNGESYYKGISDYPFFTHKEIYSPFVTNIVANSKFNENEYELGFLLGYHEAGHSFKVNHCMGVEDHASSISSKFLGKPEDLCVFQKGNIFNELSCVEYLLKNNAVPMCSKHKKRVARLKKNVYLAAKNLIGA